MDITAGDDGVASSLDGIGERLENEVDSVGEYEG
jgi:hypothetical protein